MISIEELTKLGDDWQQASHHDAFGMGAGSGTMARAHDEARAKFIKALSEARPSEVADALVELRDTKMRSVSDKKTFMRTLRDSLMGAIVDLRSNPDQVQVMMYWSKEFYEMVEKEGKPDGQQG